MSWRSLIFCYAFILTKMNWINNYVNHIVSDRSGTWNAGTVYRTCVPWILQRLRTKKLYFFVQKIQNWKFCARICQPAVGLSVQPFFFFGAFIIWGSLRSGFSINLADLWKILIMWQCDALLFPSLQCRRTFNLQRYQHDIFNATYFTGIGQH